jgi:hypothetical protein
MKLSMGTIAFRRAVHIIPGKFRLRFFTMRERGAKDARVIFYAIVRIGPNSDRPP